MVNAGSIPARPLCYKSYAAGPCESRVWYRREVSTHHFVECYLQDPAVVSED